MEININCDLGEKSKHHSNKYDPDLLEIVNSANVACGFHAGDDESMNQVVRISKKMEWVMLWRIAIILLGVAFMFGLVSYQVNNAEEYVDTMAYIILHHPWWYIDYQAWLSHGLK